MPSETLKFVCPNGHTSTFKGSMRSTRNCIVDAKGEVQDSFENLKAGYVLNNIKCSECGAGANVEENGIVYSYTFNSIFIFPKF